MMSQENNLLDIACIQKLYPFQSCFLKIKNYKYHYVDEGQGEPLVMVHGNPTWSFFFRRLIAEFKTSHRVVAPDHLGCGLSDKPQDFHYRLETHIDNLENLLLSLNLKNINLVVHDWGGAVGMGFAVRHPELIRRIVIMNSAAFTMERMPLPIALCRLPWIGEKLVRNANLFVWGAGHFTTVKPLAPEVRRGYRLPYDSYENRIAIARFVQDIPLEPDHVSYEVLAEIEHGLWMFRETPTAIVWGMRDWCFTPHFLKRWQLFYPQAETLELNAGHFVLDDAPEEAAVYIRGFIERTRKRERYSEENTGDEAIGNYSSLT